jgi:hypothetical protein
MLTLRMFGRQHCASRCTTNDIQSPPAVKMEETTGMMAMTMMETMMMMGTTTMMAMTMTTTETMMIRKRERTVERRPRYGLTSQSAYMHQQVCRGNHLWHLYFRLLPPQRPYQVSSLRHLPWLKLQRHHPRL